jgi:hypothetical protein
MTATLDRHPSLTPITRAYRARQQAANTALLTQLDTIWARYDPTNPLPTLAHIARLLTPWIIAGQSTAANNAIAYLRRLVAARHGIDPATLDPFLIPGGLIGSTATPGVDIAAVTAAAPNLYQQRVATLSDPNLAAASVRGYLASIAASEPYRVANHTTLTNATSDPRLTGRYWRATSANPCQFCQLIRERGYSEAAAGFLAHRNCHCTAEPEPAYYQRPTRADALAPYLHRP